MGWENIDVPPGFGVSPAAAGSPAGKSQRVNLAPCVNNREPKVPIDGHVREPVNGAPRHFEHPTLKTA
jgi:hypothetical protein